MNLFQTFRLHGAYFVLFCVITKVNSLLQERIRPRIINGDQATDGQFPYQVRLEVGTLYGVNTCGGAVMNERYVLTAAHCLDWFNDIQIYLGDGNISSAWNDIVHDGYDAHTLANDIALVQLMEPLVFNDYVKPISLASDPIEAGNDILVSGYGNIGDDIVNQYTLYYVILSTISNTECGKVYGENWIFNDMLCAVSKNGKTQSTCFGDSGSPAVVHQNDGEVLLVAIVSFISDRGCEHGDPSGFTRIANFKTWIEQHM